MTTVASSGEEEDRNPSHLPLAGKTIVLFEDDDLVRRATERLLRGLGAQVVVASGSGHALEMLRSADLTPDWVVADYWLTPDESGLAAIQAVVQQTEGRVKGVVLTGDSSGEIATAVSEAGLRLLRKPISVDQFIALLTENG